MFMQAAHSSTAHWTKALAIPCHRARAVGDARLAKGSLRSCMTRICQIRRGKSNPSMGERGCREVELLRRSRAGDDCHGPRRDLGAHGLELVNDDAGKSNDCRVVVPAVITTEAVAVVLTA